MSDVITSHSPAALSPRESSAAVERPAAAGVARPWSVVGMLAWREWVRFFRQPHRVAAAFGQPIILWILFGTGLHSSFAVGENGSFMSYYLPGTIALILLFTAIFATISIIEDRREGFLQNVLVSSAPRWTIVLGKAIGGGAIAWVQAATFLGLALLFGTVPWTSSLPAALVLMAAAAVAVTTIGVCFAWPMDSTQGFHAVMNLVLMPMWLLSGAFFPVPALNESSPVGQVVIHWLMRLNPMTYPVAGLQHLLSTDAATAEQLWRPSLATCWVITLLSVVVGTAAATMIVRKNKAIEAL